MGRKEGDGRKARVQRIEGGYEGRERNLRKEKRLEDVGERKKD